MNCLTEQAYETLLIEAEKRAERIVVSNKYKRKKGENNFTCWRRYVEKDAYKSYLNSKCNSKEDLFKIAGLAYSWMPTMLDFYYDENYDWSLLLKYIKQFKKDNLQIRIPLVEMLSKLVNNSIVGASKTLHIINYKFAPLIDSRVVRGWNRFFKNEIKAKKIIKLPSSWYWSNLEDHQKKVNFYIKYWDYLLFWKKTINSKVSLRDLEIIFYLLGERKKKKNARSIL